MFQFIKKPLFLGLTILSDFTNASSLNAITLSCIWMKNQKCKTRPQVVNVNGDEPVFFPFIIETINAVAVVVMLIIRMQKFVFLML